MPISEQSVAGRLSLVIPVFNESALLPTFLAGLQGLRCRGAEVIVVDGGSDDDSVATADPGVDQVLTADRGRASQMNAGAKAAHGRMLAFLHADAILSPDWCDVLQALSLAEPTWGFFPVHFPKADWLIRAVGFGMNQRSRLSGIGTGDQCIFVQASVFESIGGFPNQALMEDIEICRRLKRVAWPCIPPQRIGVSSRRWQDTGVMKTILTMWSLRLAYFLGVPPRKLHAWYYPAKQ